MSLERDEKYGLVAWTCEGCGATEERENVFTRLQFDNEWDSLREEGWAAWRERGAWRHKCPTCARKVRARDYFEAPDV